ncbi:MAG: AAA family ATPase [Planctomycetes bacterium]|nr:AAA family ATPase [Planctomycetota bacterium]
MSVIGVVNPKKGTAKSTTAVSLAAGLARRGWRVLLVDLDPQAASTTGVGLEPEALKATVFDALFGPKASLPEAIMQTSYSGLEILPANSALNAAESPSAPAGGRQETVLHMQLSAVREDYDFIIVDSPPSCGLLTSNAIVASDQLIVPVVRGSAFREDIAQLMDLISRLMGQGNPITGRIDWLWTFHQPDVPMSGDSFENAQKEWNAQAFNTLIRKDTSFQEAAWAKKPIFYYKADAPGAQDYKDLVLEVLRANDLSGTNLEMPAVRPEGQVTATPQGLSDLVRDLQSSGGAPGGAPGSRTDPAGVPAATQMMSPPELSGPDPLLGRMGQGQVTAADAAPAAGYPPASPGGVAGAAQATMLMGSAPPMPVDASGYAGDPGPAAPAPAAPGAATDAGGYAGYPAGATAAVAAPPQVTQTLVSPPPPLPAAAGDTGSMRRAGGVVGGVLSAGVDIGGSTLHVVQVRSSKRRQPSLVNFAVERLPDVPTEELEFALARTMRGIRRKMRPQLVHVHLNISGGGVVVKPLNRPVVGEKELAETLRWQHLAKGLPFSPDTALIRYCNKRAEGEEVSGRQKIFGSAADPDKVEVRASAVQRAGLAVRSVTPDVFALENLVRRSRLVAGRQAAAVLNVGLASTVLAVYGSAGLEFCRDIAIGAKDLLSIETPEAAEATADEGVEPAAKPAPEKKSAKRFVSEIMMSLEYFHQSVRTMRVEQVYLCGLRASEILEFLVDDLHVELLDPWKNIEVPEELRRDAKALGPSLAVAVGLALQEESRIDFLPSRARLLNHLASIDRVMNIVSIVLCAFIIMLWLKAVSGAAELRSKTAEQAKHLETLQDQLKRAREYEALARRLKQIKRFAEDVVPAPVRFYGIMVEIANILKTDPLKDKVYLEKVAYHESTRQGSNASGRDVIEFQVAVAVTKFEDFTSIRAALLKALGDSPFFLEANPESTVEDPGVGKPYPLKLTCKLKRPKR